MVSGYLNAHHPLPDRIRQVAERVQKRRGLRVARYRTRGDLRALVPRLKDLYNSALDGTTGNVPLTDDEAKTLADQILWFADPRLIKIVTNAARTSQSLFVCYPDISAALQRCQGRLFPWVGWIVGWSCAGQNGSTSTARAW